MSNSEYTPPESTNTGKASETADNALEKAAAATATSASKTDSTADKSTDDKAVKEPTLAEVDDVIDIAKMVNAKGNVVTDIMKSRIANHVKYLRGEVGFADQEAAELEQVSFIETVGNMLKLDFPQYVIVTDYFLGVIRENPQVFSDGLAFRFTAGLNRKYPDEYIKRYQSYIELLTKIAKNWKVRYKLGKLVDPAYTISFFDRKGQENVTQYFRKVTSA